MKEKDVMMLLCHKLITNVYGNVKTAMPPLHFFPHFLSHETWLTEPWLYSGPYPSSSTLQFRQSSVPLPVFPWQLLWQQPPLDQPPIHGVTLEWPLYGSGKGMHLDKEKQEGVIIMIREMLITLKSETNKKKISSVRMLQNRWSFLWNKKNKSFEQLWKIPRVPQKKKKNMLWADG